MYDLNPPMSDNILTLIGPNVQKSYNLLTSIDLQ